MAVPCLLVIGRQSSDSELNRLRRNRLLQSLEGLKSAVLITRQGTEMSKHPHFQITISQRIPTSLRKQVDAIAAAKGECLSEAVRNALQRYVDEFNSQAKTPAA